MLFRSNAAAACLRPGENHLVALDWWNGCRVPLGDSSVSGLMLGMNLQTTGTDLYRALSTNASLALSCLTAVFCEACFGALQQRDRFLLPGRADGLTERSLDLGRVCGHGCQKDPPQPIQFRIAPMLFRPFGYSVCFIYGLKRFGGAIRKVQSFCF